MHDARAQAYRIIQTSSSARFFLVFLGIDGTVKIHFLFLPRPRRQCASTLSGETLSRRVQLRLFTVGHSEKGTLYDSALVAAPRLPKERRALHFQGFDTKCSQRVSGKPLRPTRNSCYRKFFGGLKRKESLPRRAVYSL